MFSESWGAAFHRVQQEQDTWHQRRKEAKMSQTTPYCTARKTEIQSKENAVSDITMGPIYIPDLNSAPSEGSENNQWHPQINTKYKINTKT